MVITKFDTIACSQSKYEEPWDFVDHLACSNLMMEAHCFAF